jgi:hypothetical protein
MASAKSHNPSFSLADRLNDVCMSEPDRERAKAMMRHAETFAERVADVHRVIREAASAATSALASLQMRFKSAVSHAADR